MVVKPPPAVVILRLCGGEITPVLVILRLCGGEITPCGGEITQEAGSGGGGGGGGGGASKASGGRAERDRHALRHCTVLKLY
eukprot:1186998-Prorocentrum_minimum.AAC.2